METLLTILTLSSLLFSTFAINFQNNACPMLFDYHLAPFNRRCYVNPDVLSDVENMVRRNKYELKTYSVVTVDGYILNLFQISRKLKDTDETTPTKKNPIFIQHGILINSGSWVNTGRRSIVFYFADLGYDVWLGNLRGTIYSNRHVNLTVHDRDYWNFNLDTLAEQDVRAQLNFVYEANGHKIHYIGHSMGTTLSLMYISTFGIEANEMLQSVSLLAPICYLYDIPIWEFFEIISPFMTGILNLLRIRGFFYHEKAIHIFLTTICKWFPEICYVAINVLAGKTTQFPSKDLLLFFSYWPSGGSMFQLQQYGQFITSKKFQKFDYGPIRNMKMYESEKPPVYNLAGIELPICLFYGENDGLYRKENIERLYNEIGSNKKCKYSVFASGHKYYNHIDFLHGKSIRTDLYSTLSDTLIQHESINPLNN